MPGPAHTIAVPEARKIECQTGDVRSRVLHGPPWRESSTHSLADGDPEKIMQEPLSIKSAALWRPPLPEIAQALQTGLSAHYAHVAVAVEDCPNLREWGCTVAGLSGHTRILDVGGEAYAHNKRYRHHQFHIPVMAEACGLPTAHVFGAGMACPAMLDSHCGELIANLALPGPNRSKVARVGQNQECLVADYAALVHSGLSNLYLSDGRPGPVVKVNVATRIGDEPSVTQAMRQSLIDHLPVDGVQQIALGGIFRLTAGQVRAHVMPDYNCIGFEYFDETRNKPFRDFLQFYTMGPNLLCFSLLWTGDPTGSGLHLRPSGEHTHFYSLDGKPEAGHYHGDVTPDCVAYTGYFHPADSVFRIHDLQD